MESGKSVVIVDVDAIVNAYACCVNISWVLLVTF